MTKGKFKPLTKEQKMCIEKMHKLAEKKIYQVGKAKPRFSSDAPSKITLSYKDIMYHADDFVDASKFLPADYDLCMLIVEFEGKEIRKKGWITPNWTWDGAKVNENTKVKAWRRLHD